MEVRDISEENNSDQWTTKERAPHPYWLYSYACNVSRSLLEFKPLLSWKEYRERMKLLAKIRKERKAINREPIAKQIEIEFPLTLTPINNEELQKTFTEGYRSSSLPWPQGSSSSSGVDSAEVHARRNQNVKLHAVGPYEVR